jgi:hypothetical protein
MSTNISEFKNLVAVDVLPCPDIIVNREVVSILLEFCRKTNILQRDFQMDVDSGDIDDERQNCIDFEVSEFAQGLRPVTVVEFMVDGQTFKPWKQNIRSTNDYFETVEDSRYKYFWIPDDNHIRVFDMSSNDSKMWMNVAFVYDRTATTVDDFIFDDWSEAIVCGAKYKILNMPGKEWTDKASAKDYRAMWRKYLSQAKQQALRGGSGQTQGVNWKSFGELD